MSEPVELSPEDLTLLRAALDGPLFDRDPMAMHLCLRLCGLRLMQRAGPQAAANGWRGSPHAFVLTREGWARIKASRRRAPMRQVG